MARKIEMSKDEQILYNELKRLAKQANQRILRLERLTGIKEGFAVKELVDLLSTSQLNAISETGRIRVSKQYNIKQLDSIIKATNQFLASSLSKVSGVKKYTLELEKNLDKFINYAQANIVYRSKDTLKWIYSKFEKDSDFWIFTKKAIELNFTKEEYIQELKNIAGITPEEELSHDLEALYQYVTVR